VPLIGGCCMDLLLSWGRFDGNSAHTSGRTIDSQEFVSRLLGRGR
jgi:hypothetical protein